MTTLEPQAAAPCASVDDIRRLRDLSAAQWKSGVAAWLGWLFDGLDMHLYTLVALPFVAELVGTSVKDPRVGTYGSLVQASFLVGWGWAGRSLAASAIGSVGAGRWC